VSEPGPCEHCGRSIDQHFRLDTDYGPAFFCSKNDARKYLDDMAMIGKPAPRPTISVRKQPLDAGGRVKAAIEIGEACFAKLCREFGEPTARLVMKRCADITEAPAPVRPPRKLQDVKLPPAAEIEAMTCHKVCEWWRRIQDNGQVFEGGQKQSLTALAKRYRECDGYQGSILLMPLPFKQKGASRKVRPPAAELPAMFDLSNPQSAFSIEKAKRNGRLTKERFAELVIEQHGTKYGPTVEAVLRNLRRWQQKINPTV
jgi:hypothetical protein